MFRAFCASIWTLGCFTSSIECHLIELMNNCLWFGHFYNINSACENERSFHLLVFSGVLFFFSISRFSLYKFLPPWWDLCLGIFAVEVTFLPWILPQKLIIDTWESYWFCALALHLQTLLKVLWEECSCGTRIMRSVKRDTLTSFYLFPFKSFF